MNTSISNTPAETALTQMASGAEAPRQDLKAGQGGERSDFACLMAQHCRAPAGAESTAPAGLSASGDSQLLTQGPLALVSQLDIISGMLGMSEEMAAAEAMVSLPQGLQDGNQLPLPEIVAALEGAAEALEGVAEALEGVAEVAQSVAALGQQMAQTTEQAEAQLEMVSGQLGPQLLDQMGLQALEQPEQGAADLQPEVSGASLPTGQETETSPLGYALGYQMLQQTSGPIGRHLGQYEGQVATPQVGLQLGHQLRQQAPGQQGRSAAGDGAGSTTLPAGSTPAAESADMQAQDELNAQLSQLTMRSAPVPTPAQEVVTDLAPGLVRAAAVAEPASLPMGSVVAAANTPAAASAATTLSHQAPPVQVAPGQQGWDQAMGERVLWMVGKQIQGAEVRINPPHLGPVEIRVSIQHDQASVSFTAHHAGVREALESAIPRLREMLGENNLQLANVDVGQRDTGQQRGPSDFFRRMAAGGAEHGQLAGEGDDGLGLSLRSYQSEGIVDYYA